jgi:hypothetical protein
MPLENVGPPTAYSLAGWRQALICQLHSARADEEEVVEVVPPAISNPDGEVGRLLLAKVDEARGRLAALANSPEWQNALPYEPSRDSFFWAITRYAHSNLPRMDVTERCCSSLGYMRQSTRVVGKSSIL